MKAKELKTKTIDELRKLEAQLREQLRQLRFDLASGKVKNVKRIKEIRKDIARILTAINQKVKKPQ
jgi:large subunit ribosomal protein L29